MSRPTHRPASPRKTGAWPCTVALLVAVALGVGSGCAGDAPEVESAELAIALPPVIAISITAAGVAQTIAVGAEIIVGACAVTPGCAVAVSDYLVARYSALVEGIGQV